MQIALIGYGKMGRTIEQIGARQGHDFPLVIDEENIEDLHGGNLVKVDVAIEFSTPSAAPGNIIACLSQGVPVVSGTTGWNDRFSEIETICRQKEGALFYASNFSIGVNILFAMNEKLARIMDQFPEYAASIKEIHHIHKLDAPSGTAITLAEQIIREHSRIEKWQLGNKESRDCLPIEALREGEVKGYHAIRYESGVDALSLIHDAKTRDAFASGALLAAGFLPGKKGVYGMKDLLKL